MELEQIHFPHEGTNWGKIILVSVVIISALALTYIAFKPKNIVTESNVKNEEERE